MQFLVSNLFEWESLMNDRFFLLANAHISTRYCSTFLTCKPSSSSYMTWVSTQAIPVQGRTRENPWPQIQTCICSGNLFFDIFAREAEMSLKLVLTKTPIIQWKAWFAKLTRLLHLKAKQIDKKKESEVTCVLANMSKLASTVLMVYRTEIITFFSTAKTLSRC